MHPSCFPFCKNITTSELRRHYLPHDLTELESRNSGIIRADVGQPREIMGYSGILPVKILGRNGIFRYIVGRNRLVACHGDIGIGQHSRVSVSTHGTLDTLAM